MMIPAYEVRPRDRLVGPNDVVNTVVLQRDQVTILLDPVAAPPGHRFAPDMLLWVDR